MPTRDTAPLGAPIWIDLMSSDLDAARSFYADLFGWTSESAGEDYGGYVRFYRDGVDVADGMQNDPSFGAPDGWSVYLASADAQATCDAAVAHGGSVIVAPMPIPELGVMAVVADAGGAAIGVWEPAPFQGIGVLAEPGAPAWFELNTRDHDASVAFYKAVFGWDTHVASDTPEFRYTTLGKDDDALAGIMDASAFLPEGTPAHWSVYVNVADTDEAVARAEELGGSVLMPAEDTPYGRIAMVADPTGAAIKLQSDA